MHFQRVRSAAIGPDLSHRRTVIDSVLRSPPVREAIAEQARKEKISEYKAWKQGRKFAFEIAANYSYAFVRVASFALTWFWNKIYDGVELQHFREIPAAGPELRNHLRALPPQPYRLPAGIVFHLSQRPGAAPCRCRREPEPAGAGTLSAQGRRLFPAPQLPFTETLLSRISRIPRPDSLQRHCHRVFHRRNPQPHGATAATQRPGCFR